MTSVRLHVTSEIYAETDFHCSPQIDGKTVSRFVFRHPSTDEADHTSTNASCRTDKDGDFELKRRVERKDVIEIEHHNSTDLTLVGLQVWRGALLLADYCLHERQQFAGKRIMELGSGVGLTGIAAAMYADRVICTDINLGGILELIGSNIRRNKRLLKNTTSASNMSVMELDFMKTATWSTELRKAIDETDVFLVADVIYDDELTDAFLRTIDVLLTRGGGKTIYIALEKRYVFTLADLESLAPCYEYFLTGMDKLRRQRPQWRFDAVPVDFAQYFEYERVKELVLLRLRSE